MRPSKVETRLRAQGYEPRRPEVLALAGALQPGREGSGARALLLEGPPGVGKTALAEAVAGALGAPLLACQMHAWTDSDELFVGVDVVAAVAGDARAVRQDGVLARAARASEEHERVVVLLDEVDKAPQRAEALLLDWLQSGRVPVEPGVHLRTRLDRVLVVLTSNAQRQLGDALLRRCRRVVMTALPVEKQVEIITTRTGAPAGVVRVVWRAAREVARQDEATISLQEGERLVGELLFAEGLADLRLSLEGWAARGDAGRAAARRMNLAPVWGEIVASRRREA